jgi:hypothetical protein
MNPARFVWLCVLLAVAAGGASFPFWTAHSGLAWVGGVLTGLVAMRLEMWRTHGL